MSSDWVARFADEVIAESERRVPGEPVVCESGISPSGPIHLGNLREVMTPHLVADEIRRRGVPVRHLLSWDDYDRFRRVPAGFDQSWSEHVGKPLSAVPAPPGSEYETWADHFRAPLLGALADLGVEFDPISQTEKYTSGAYTEQVLLAMRERARIDAILGEYRTKRRGPKKTQAPDTDDTVAQALAAEGSGAAADDDGSSASGYYPYRPYCAHCHRDTTTVTGYDDATTELTYTCECGHTETIKLTENHEGKLVWKVDWPMRWAYEGVIFEPSGVDHSSPGSSYVVGGRIVRDIFSGTQPIGPMYAFVGLQGMAKMSSSRGGVPTPAQALEIMEPELLRWLFTRKRPNQAITVSFGQELQRLYDEWDALSGKVSAGTAGEAEVDAQLRAASTAAGPLPVTPLPLPFGTLGSIADVTAGDEAQMLRVVRDLRPEEDITDLAVTRPRLDLAQRWVTTQLPADSRTQVRATPDAELLAGLDDSQRAGLAALADGLASNWTLSGLTTLIYGVPKKLLGLPADAAPTQELKVAQRTFFALVYRLLVGRETGPRLPTLLLAVGADRARTLLGRAS